MFNNQAVLERRKQEEIEKIEKAKVELEKKKKEEEDRELNRKEFTNLKSVCLDCQQAFIANYIDNPDKTDPMIVACTNSFAINQLHRYTEAAESGNLCNKNGWRVKLLSCSFFKNKNSQA